MTVMSWTRDLPITWSQHVTTYMICSHDPNTWPTNFILISSHHQYQHPHHHSHIITTSGSLICHTTITSFHHYDTCRPSSKDLVLASSKVLWRPIRKTTSRSTPVLESGGGSLNKGKCPQLLLAWSRGSTLNCYNKKTTTRATSEVVKEDGWPDAAWPDPLGYQYQLQPWTTILLDE